MNVGRVCGRFVTVAGGKWRAMEEDWKREEKSDFDFNLFESAYVSFASSPWGTCPTPERGREDSLAICKLDFQCVHLLCFSEFQFFWACKYRATLPSTLSDQNKWTYRPAYFSKKNSLPYKKIYKAKKRYLHPKFVFLPYTRFPVLQKQCLSTFN